MDWYSIVIQLYREWRCAFEKLTLYSESLRIRFRRGGLHLIIDRLSLACPSTTKVFRVSFEFYSWYQNTVDVEVEFAQTHCPRNVVLDLVSWFFSTFDFGFWIFDFGVFILNIGVWIWISFMLKLWIHNNACQQRIGKVHSRQQEIFRRIFTKKKDWTLVLYSCCIGFTMSLDFI